LAQEGGGEDGSLGVGGVELGGVLGRLDERFSVLQEEQGDGQGGVVGGQSLLDLRVVRVVRQNAVVLGDGPLQEGTGLGGGLLGRGGRGRRAGALKERAGEEVVDAAEGAVVFGHLGVIFSQRLLGGDRLVIQCVGPVRVSRADHVGQRGAGVGELG